MDDVLYLGWIRAAGLDLTETGFYRVHRPLHVIEHLLPDLFAHGRHFALGRTVLQISVPFNERRGH